MLFALGLILIGMGSSVTHYSSLYYAVHLIKKKGRGTGIHESIVGSGALLGPILGGIAAQYAGLRPYLVPGRLCSWPLSPSSVSSGASLPSGLVLSFPSPH